MRRRYSGKRSLRRVQRKRRGKRSRISRTALKTIDHCKSGAKLAPAIARGISRKAYTTTTITTTKHLAVEPFVVNSIWMTPFHKFTSLGGSTVGDIDALCPIHLIGTEGTLSTVGSQEWMRHMNMYRQFRVKAIRFEYVPTNCIVGGESSLPVQAAGAAITSDDATSAMISANTDASSCVWVIRWPNKTGQFQDWGVNLYGTDPNNANLKNSNQLADPQALFVPVSEKLVLFWKPKVMGMKQVNFMPTVPNALGQAANFMPTSLSAAKPFPWVNIIDNYDSGNAVVDSAPLTGQNLNTFIGAPNNHTGLFYAMSQPLISMYNTRTNQFVSDAVGRVTNGRWRIQTVFEFRHKMGYTANIQDVPPSVVTQLTVDEYYDSKQNI